MIVFVRQDHPLGEKVTETDLTRTELDELVAQAAAIPFSAEGRSWRVMGWDTITYRAEDTTPIEVGLLIVEEWVR